MSISILESLLVDSYDDFKLSSDERHELKSILGEREYATENLNYLRNRAFSMVANNFRSDKAQFTASLKWLEKVVKSIDAIRQSNSSESGSHFSPGTDCADRIISLLGRAKSSVDVCVFTISDDRISEAIASAHRRGVKIRIVSDNDKANDRGSDIYALSSQGLMVRIDHSPNHMHHKFAIFDQTQLVNGSFNWTRSASTYNQENIVVTTDSRLIDSFAAVFNKLWNDSVVVGK